MAYIFLLLFFLPFYHGFLPFGKCEPHQFPKSSTIFASSRVSHHSMNQTQRNDVINALLAFKRRISDPNRVLAGWNSSINSNPCNWRGVSCSHGPTSRVKKLNLAAANLTGALVGELGQLRYLIHLNLSSNTFSGPIPPQIGNLRSLTLLDLSQNQLQGNIPPKILSSLQKLTVMRLDDNMLNGSIPSQLGDLRELLHLNLSANWLSGIIPMKLGKLLKLEVLDLSQNSLTGTIPSELGRLMNLHSLSLSRNKLTRVHPSLTFNNRSSLVLINFCNNHLSGALPESWGQNRNLRVITVGYNRLQGNLPDWLWDLSSLQLLDFSNNKFSGKIHRRIGLLQALIKHGAAESQPETLWQDKLILNFKGGELFYTYFFSTQAFLDLSGNLLTGQIPSQLGLLNGLRNLNLSNNSLTGNIPLALRNLTLLESLDLSMNALDGQIPTALTDIVGLAYLNLSYNNFCGAIPTGRPFNTFDNSSYLGNIFLRNGDQAESNTEHGGQRARVALIASILAGALFLSAILRCCCYYRSASRSSAHEKTEIRCFGAEGLKPPLSDLSDLSDATNGFSEAAIIGTGALSKVYKGILRNGQVVAIKILELAHNESLRSFVKECEVLGKIRHRNLVKILGALSMEAWKPGSLGALVLQFMPNGSLEKYLHHCQVCQLTWEARYKIVTGIAQAINYLHSETGMGAIVHCDLKPSNVLLDQDMEAHVCDFGIARIIDPQITEATPSSTFRGTIGYVAPEFGYGDKISAKADVYSYGVLLLEMVTRKSPTEGLPVGFYSLAEWVRWCLQGEQFPEIIVAEVIDPSLSQAMDIESTEASADSMVIMEEIIAVLRLGIVCCRNDPKERPPMSAVLDMLRNIKKTKHNNGDGNANFNVSATTTDSILRYLENQEKVQSTDTSTSSY